MLEKWITESETTTMIRLTDEMRTPSARLPQYLFLHYDEKDVYDRQFLDTAYKIWERENVLKLYDKMDSFFYWNRMKVQTAVQVVVHRHLYKLKPEFEHRMIRKGYRDAKDKSLGKYMDIERSFHGYPGPLTTRPKYQLD